MTAENMETTLARIDERTKTLTSEVAEIKHRLEDRYVPNDLFESETKTLYTRIQVLEEKDKQTNKMVWSLAGGLLLNIATYLINTFAKN